MRHVQESVDLKIADFGKNTFQHQVDFKFECLDRRSILQIASRLVVQHKRFELVAKDQATGQTFLTHGSGTKDSPYFRLRMGPNQVILWGGWYIPFDEWQQWTISLLPQVTPFLEAIPIEFVGDLLSQAVVLAPTEALKPTRGLADFEELLRFYGAFVPDEFSENFGGIWSFWHKGGGQRIDYLVTPTPNPNEVNITLNSLRDELNKGATLVENWHQHLQNFDHIVAKFQSGLLSLLLK